MLQRTGMIRMNPQIKKFLTVTAIVLLAYLVISRPNESAAMVQDLLGMLRGWAEGIITFLQSLFV
jgi:hypothetical protein